MGKREALTARRGTGLLCRKVSKILGNTSEKSKRDEGARGEWGLAKISILRGGKKKKKSMGEENRELENTQAQHRSKLIRRPRLAQVLIIRILL